MSSSNHQHHQEEYDEEWVPLEGSRGGKEQGDSCEQQQGEERQQQKHSSFHATIHVPSHHISNQQHLFNHGDNQHDRPGPSTNMPTTKSTNNSNNRSNNSNQRTRTTAAAAAGTFKTMEAIRARHERNIKLKHNFVNQPLLLFPKILFFHLVREFWNAHRSIRVGTLISCVFIFFPIMIL